MCTCFSQLYKSEHLSQNPLLHVEVLQPARPVFSKAVITEHTTNLEWSIEGAADTVHIWNEPRDGSCSTSLNGYCELDVKRDEVLITNLVAGQG